jgi:hypothetical protein
MKSSRYQQTINTTTRCSRLCRTGQLRCWPMDAVERLSILLAQTSAVHVRRRAHAHTQNRHASQVRRHVSRVGNAVRNRRLLGAMRQAAQQRSQHARRPCWRQSAGTRRTLRTGRSGRSWRSSDRRRGTAAWRAVRPRRSLWPGRPWRPWRPWWTAYWRRCDRSERCADRQCARRRLCRRSVVWFEVRAPRFFLFCPFVGLLC